MRRIALLIAPFVMFQLYVTKSAAGPVHAAFPGTNGRISFTRFVPETNGNEVFSIRVDGRTPTHVRRSRSQQSFQ